MTTNISDRRIERAMLDAMTGSGAANPNGPGAPRVKAAASGGWILGDADHYDRALAMDLTQLTTFVEMTQPTSDATREALDLSVGSPARQAFLTQLDHDIAERGVIDVLRRGVQVGELHVDLFYGMQAAATAASSRPFTQNRFSLIPRLQYSQDETRPAVDLCLFVNGLPLVTFVLADGPTARSAEDAVAWYRDLDALGEPLFQPGRCIAHFAVDQRQALVCSELRGAASIFRTFNQGASEAEGNPQNLFGIATDYLWRRILTRLGMMDIIDNFAQMMETEDEATGEIRTAPVFPRYHQLEVVNRLLADVEQHNVGRSYLIQHSNGSGSTYALAWLAGQLIGVQQDGIRVFDTIIVLTDRPAVERRLRDTVRGFTELGARIGPDPDASATIHESLGRGLSIILASVEHLRIVLDEIDAHQRGRRFAIVLDEASSAAEDQVNGVMSGRPPHANTSTFVFTPAANDTTLELFGQPFNERGTTKYRPYHVYTS